MRIADFSIRRPVFAVMLIAALVSLGAVSLGRLGVDLFPLVEPPMASVSTVLEGATPESVETEVTDPLEEAINGISGLDELKSISSEGLSQIFVRFDIDEDPDAKAQDVRDKVGRARGDLPRDTEAPVIEKLDPAGSPILSVMVSGPLSIRELTDFADDVVKERLQRLPGVGSVTLVGGREREVRIWIDANRLRSYGLAVDDVIRAIRSEHADVPGGRLEAAGRTAEFSVKTKGEVEAVREFADIVVAYRDGAPTRVGDVARVEDGLADERTYAELDGQPGVSLEVRKQSRRNTVEVARAVRQEVARLQGQLPAGMEVVVARDISRFIESSARDVAGDLVLGGLLAMLTTFAFLRSLRATLIVGIAIPTSIISTFFLFYVMDFTLNMFTLMALSVSIGLLVDDAIVVLESIHSRIEAGDEPFAAASDGSASVAGAVVAGTLSIVSVFAPIAFMHGMIGKFFYEYGMAICFAVSVSLLVAVTLTPTASARFLRAGGSHGRVYRALERLYAALERAYQELLERALRHRAAVVGLAVAATAIGVVLAGMVPLSLDPKVDRSEFQGLVELPPGTGIATAREVGRRSAAQLAGIPFVERVFLTVGGGAQGRVNELSLYVQLTPKNERPVSQFELMDEARARLVAAAPEARRTAVLQVSWQSGGGFVPYDMEYGLSGPDLGELGELAADLAARMSADPTFLDAKSGLEPGKPEVQVRIDRRRAADLGVPVRTVADAVRALVGGVDVGTFEEGGDRHDVRLRLEEDQRDDLAQLTRIQVRAADGALVDLGNVAHVDVESGPAQIERFNRARQVSVLANTPASVAKGTAAARIDALVAEMGLPPGYTGKHLGQTERMKESAAAMLFAFFMALVALYMVIGSQFNSFVQPAVIMLTAPLSFVGAFAALVATRTELSIFAQIGILALMGLVMKNGILLVDYANQRRAEGASSREAMVQAGRARLRPVMMTALSTIAGMVPVALARSDAAEWRSPMGILVIGGLSSSMLLTLVVVPVAYTLVDELREAAARLAQRLPRRRRAPLPAPPPGTPAGGA